MTATIFDAMFTAKVLGIKIVPFTTGTVVDDRLDLTRALAVIEQARDGVAFAVHCYIDTVQYIAGPQASQQFTLADTYADALSVATKWIAKQRIEAPADG